MSAFLWKCDNCGAVHDERENAALFPAQNKID